MTPLQSCLLWYCDILVVHTGLCLLCWKLTSFKRLIDMIINNALVKRGQLCSLEGLSVHNAICPVTSWYVQGYRYCCLSNVGRHNLHGGGGSEKYQIVSVWAEIFRKVMKIWFTKCKRNFNPHFDCEKNV